MEDKLKASIVQNVLDRKFSRANSEFANMMRDKAYAAIDDFKNAFKYVAVQKAETEKPEPAKEPEKKSEKKTTEKKEK